MRFSSRALSHALPNYQKGFLSQRTWAILAILCVLLAVPFWMAKKVNSKTAAEVAVINGKQDPADAARTAAITQASAAEKAAMGNSTVVDANGVEQTNPALVAAATQAAAASPDRFGLSFGFGQLVDKPELVYSACAGTPLDMDNANKKQCNPYQGDTSCRAALPLLCILKDGSGESAGGDLPASWAGGALGATAPTAGFMIGSLTQANARCAAELGAGWRMAEFHDAAGSGMVGKRSSGLASTNTRHWVYINDQPANCWDGKAQ